MIKEEQYAEADPDRVGNLQDGKAGGAFSRDKGVKLAQKGCPRSTSLLKVIMEKAAPKKETRHTKKIFTYRKSFPCGGTDAVGDDEIRFSRWEKYQ